MRYLDIQGCRHCRLFQRLQQHHVQPAGIIGECAFEADKSGTSG